MDSSGFVIVKHPFLSRPSRIHNCFISFPTPTYLLQSIPAVQILKPFKNEYRNTRQGPYHSDFKPKPGAEHLLIALKKQKKQVRKQIQYEINGILQSAYSHIINQITL